MTTVEKVLLDARALLDEFTDDGVLLAQSEVADIEARGIRFADMAQKEMFRTGNIYKEYKITNKEIENKLGRFSNFDLKEYKGTPIFVPETGGVVARSYHFSCTSDFTVEIQEFEGGTWSVLQTITAVITQLTDYKGSFTPTTTGNLIRFAFKGTYYYKFNNVALFDVPFKPGTVPTYKAWVPYVMPTDFRMVDCVIQEYPSRQYSKDPNYKWEGFNTFYLNYFYEGEVRIIYKPVPVTLTLRTDIFEIDDITVNAITYYVAAKLAPSEYAELTNFFEGKFNELKSESFIKMPSSEQAIVEFYGGYNGNL